MPTRAKGIPPSRKSFSSEHVYRVIVGEGNVGGDNVMIDNPLVKFERTAAERHACHGLAPGDSLIDPGKLHAADKAL